MAKNFKVNNPNNILSAKEHIETKPAAVDAPTPEPTPAPIPITEPTPIDINKKEDKKKPDYLRLDVTDYKDYVSLMAEHESNTTGKYVSMTQYILRLIEADKQKNIETYKKLEQIEQMKRELI